MLLALSHFLLFVGGFGIGASWAAYHLLQRHNAIRAEEAAAYERAIKAEGKTE